MVVDSTNLFSIILKLHMILLEILVLSKGFGVKENKN